MNADHLVGWALVAIGLWAIVAIVVAALVLALVEALKPWADRTVQAHIDAADQYPEPERFDRWHEDLGSDYNHERRTQ